MRKRHAFQEKLYRYIEEKKEQTNVIISHVSHDEKENNKKKEGRKKGNETM